MDEICLPVCYDGLSELDMQAHLRHCATKLKDQDRAELLLCEAGVVIPAVKRIYRTKSATLVLLARCDSVGREHLPSLRDRLESAGYDLKLSFTTKRKLLSRIAIPIAVDEPLYPLKALRVLQVIASQLNSPWPQTMSACYGVRSDEPGLPGQVTISVPILSASRKLGFAIGSVIRMLRS